MSKEVLYILLDLIVHFSNHIPWGFGETFCNFTNKLLLVKDNDGTVVCETIPKVNNSAGILSFKSLLGEVVCQYKSNR